MNNKEIDTNTSSPMDIENDEGFQQSNEAMARQGGGEWTVNCDCRETSAKMKVRKDGTNKGREYYCCAKPRDADDHCRYFQWVDEVDGLQGEATGGGDDIPSSSHGKGQFIFFLMRHPQSVKRRHYSVKGE